MTNTGHFIVGMVQKRVLPDDLTWRQAAVLSLLGDGERQVKALAEILNVPRPIITRALDKLEFAELALRAGPRKGDRRTMMVRATSRGRRLIDKIEALAKQEIAI